MEPSIHPSVFFLQKYKKELVIFGLLLIALLSFVFLNQSNLLPAFKKSGGPSSPRELEERMKILQDLGRQSEASPAMDERHQILNQIMTKALASEEVEMPEPSREEKLRIVESLAQ